MYMYMYIHVHVQVHIYTYRSFVLVPVDFPGKALYYFPVTLYTKLPFLNVCCSVWYMCNTHTPLWGDYLMLLFTVAYDT